MIEQLFGSKTRVKLLKLFYTNPNRSFYVREITRKIEEQINSVRRELANLLSIGIISSDANNNRLYYEVNQDHEYYSALSMIFGGAAKKSKKSMVKGEKESSPKVDVSEEHPLAMAIKDTGRVDLVILTGQFTRDELSGIDILIVGDINQSKLNRFIGELEKSENKDIRYTVLTFSGYQYRVQINDRFINNVLESKKQVIINHQNILVE
jgi:predicted transcriptional regulator